MRAARALDTNSRITRGIEKDLASEGKFFAEHLPDAALEAMSRYGGGLPRRNLAIRHFDLTFFAYKLRNASGAFLGFYR